MSQSYRVYGIGFVCLLLAVAAGGCSGGADFGESISIPQEQHARVGDVLGAGKALRLPADAPFNITDAQRFSKGDAAAEASVDPSGNAACSAKAGADGSAWAEFELGHVLRNHGDQPLDVTVTFNVACAYRGDGQVSTLLAKSNQFALKVFIVDSDRRVLNRMMLAQPNPSRGPTTWTGTETPTFDTTFEPGLAYHLVLAGRVEVAGDDQRSPTAEIEIQSLNIGVIPR